FNDFLDDAKNGNLPAYSLIEPRHLPDVDLPNGQHPPHGVTAGEQLIASRRERPPKLSSRSPRRSRASNKVGGRHQRMSSRQGNAGWSATGRSASSARAGHGSL